MSDQIDRRIFRAANEFFPAPIALNITAQARHESGNYHSNVFKTLNNLFGYKYIGQPGATKGTPAPIGEGGYYAKYSTLEGSVNELAKWIKRRISEGKFSESNLYNSNEYAAALKAGAYFTDNLKNYQAGLKTALAKIKINSQPGTANNWPGVILLTVLFFAYFVFKK